MARWTLTVEEGAGLAGRLIAVESSATDMDTGESVGVVVFEERTPFPLPISKSGSVAVKQLWSLQITDFGGVVVNPKPAQLRFVIRARLVDERGNAPVETIVISEAWPRTFP
jgi:hypothetical protein